MKFLNRVWRVIRAIARFAVRRPKIFGVLTVLVLVSGWLTFDYYRTETHLVLFSKSERLTPEEGGGWRVSFVPVRDGVPNLDRADQFDNRDASLVRWKRDSGKIDGQLNALPKGALVEVRVYGWRSTLFSSFQNILDIEVVGVVETQPTG